MNNLNLNIDSATVRECTVGTYKWGETIFHNICNDSIDIVAWGAIDYWLAIFIISLSGLLLFKILGSFIE